MKIVPFKQRNASNVILSAILGVGSAVLAVLMWLVVAGGSDYMILVVLVAMLPTIIAIMSLLSLITGKPWYLEVLVAAALLHF